MTIAVLVLAASPAAAQGTRDPAPPALEPSSVVENADPRAWSYSASVFSYFVPDDQGFAQPTLAADHGRLHLEARYNYEALETGSAWLGYAFSAGKHVKVDITPMLGGVFGDLHGIAPSYGLTLGWSKLELYSEGEYFFDLRPTSSTWAGRFRPSWSRRTWASEVGGSACNASS